jgi:uncharacterized membrane protein YuzA (DUF378 family)
MKASQHNAAGILLYLLLSAGVLSWGLFSLHGIDLVSEPFGSIMVLSRTILSLAALAVTYQLMQRQATPARQAIRVRARGGLG